MHEAFGNLLRGEASQLGTRHDEFVAWAIAHRIAPYAWHLASKADTALAARLQQPRARFAAIELARGAWLSGVLRGLESGGISTIVFKGLGVAHTYYPSVGLRPLGDVDLLFPEAEIGAALAVLEAHGFAANHDPLAARFNREVNHNFPLRHAEHGLLEAHHALYEDCANALTLRFIERSAPATILGAKVRIPRPDDLFLVLAAHWAASNPGSKWVWLLDLALIGAKLDAEDWRVLARSAERYGLQVFVVAALSSLNQVWGVRFDAAKPAHDLERRLTTVEQWATSSLADCIADRREFGNGLCLSRRFSGRPTRRGFSWLIESFWAPPSVVCLALGVDHTSRMFWWHRMRHTWRTNAARLQRVVSQ